MTLLELNKKLESTKYPVAFRAFPVEEEPALPYVCYQTPQTNTFYADGEVVYQSTQIVVDLYTLDKDTKAERRVETALKNMTWTKEEYYLTKEKVYCTEYQIES